MNALGYHFIQLCECLRVVCVRDIMLSIYFKIFAIFMTR